MKGKFKKFIATLLAAVTCLTMGACAGNDVVNPDNPDIPGIDDEQIDSSKTQLYVFNFYGGYGADWLAAAKKKYEDLHKDDVYEEGKKGIQIYVNNQKSNAGAVQSQILDNRDEVYFTEYAYYYSMKAEGVLGDITDAVTADLKSFGDKDGSTIESKLTAEQKAYFGVSESDGKTHYYAIPHYSAYTGIIYDIDLFDENLYYFAKTPTGSALEELFVADNTVARSAGPDGVEGTDDDGLPATYDEFFKLCEYIKQGAATPLVWTGANYKDYLNSFMTSLATDYEGLDQMMLNYTLSDSATDLGTAQNGQFVKDASATAITESNGYELARQAGKYYALQFVEKICRNDNYHFGSTFNSAYSHMNAQEDFLYSGKDGETDPIAMLIDGIWWESEATPTFNEMTSNMGEQYSKANRNFGFMPFPKATQEKVAEGKKTLYDHIFSMCFMKANIEEWKKPIAYDFIKFVNSDAQLVEYSQITDTPKALNYTMDDAQLDKMSPFGRSVIKAKQSSDIVYPFSTAKKYVNNQSSFAMAEMFRTSIGSSEYQWAANAFHENNSLTVDAYFGGMKTYTQNNWSKLA